MESQCDGLEHEEYENAISAQSLFCTASTLEEFSVF